MQNDKLTLEDLTPEIEAKIPQYIERALKGVFDGGRCKSYNEAKAEAAIFNTYVKCDYEKPVVLTAGGAMLQHVHDSNFKESMYESKVEIKKADHNAIELPPGTYEFYIQNAYNPFKKIFEKVID